jgi:hypothetical protein
MLKVTLAEARKFEERHYNRAVHTGRADLGFVEVKLHTGGGIDPDDRALLVDRQAFHTDVYAITAREAIDLIVIMCDPFDSGSTDPTFARMEAVRMFIDETLDGERDG